MDRNRVKCKIITVRKLMEKYSLINCPEKNSIQVTKNDTVTSVRKFKEGLIVICERKTIVQTVCIRRNYDAELVLGEQPIYIFFPLFLLAVYRESSVHMPQVKMELMG